MLEEDLSFNCPYCGSEMSLIVEADAGKRQEFVHDCETCCRPIQVRVRFENGEMISFNAEAES